MQILLKELKLHTEGVAEQLRKTSRIRLLILITNLYIFEWYVVRCGFKNGCWKDLCLKVIGLCVQNMMTILDSMINIVMLRDRLRNMRILHFSDEHNVRTNSKHYEECGFGKQSVIILCFHTQGQRLWTLSPSERESAFEVVEADLEPLTMDRENRPLFTGEPVEVQDFRK